MKLYFAGAEAPTLRRRLVDAGATHFAASYWHLRDRLPKDGTFPFRERFPTDAEILLDSGGFTANNSREEYDEDFFVDYLNGYVEFVEKHIDQLDLVTEFDLLDYSVEDLWALRYDVWSKFPPEKFLPVWHVEHGFDELHMLANSFPKIAVTGEALKEMGQRLPAVANKYGVRFHGLSVTSEKLIKTAALESVSSTSWISPTRHGDRVVWDGTLHRYPKKYADRALTNHRDTLEREGFDLDLLAAGDAEELSAMTVWSMQAWAANLDRMGLVTRSGVEETGPKVEPGAGRVGGLPPEGGNREVVPRGSDLEILPVVGFETGIVKSLDSDGDESLQMHTAVASARQCNPCYIKNVCPKYEADASCAYQIPIEVKSKEQLTALLTGMLEMQSQRVLFARFAEELEGGYPTEKVSTELDRLMEMTKKTKDIQDDRDFMRIQVEARGNAGVLSRIFGERAGEVNRELERPLPPQATDALLAEVVDADVE